MSVVVVDSQPRDGGMVEVRLSQDSLSFTVTVPGALADSPEAMTVYQAMADTVCGNALELRSIVDAQKEL